MSVKELYARVYEKHTNVKLPEDAHPCASWYHLVIGYDAGYYGYGWSDVYAADVYETLENSPGDSISAENGAKLRDTILAPCATLSGFEMLRRFLGREPNSQAWLRRNGVPM